MSFPGGHGVYSAIKAADAEYHEAGDEGAEQALPARESVTEDQAAALNSMRDVPTRIVEESDDNGDADAAKRRAA